MNENENNDNMEVEWVSPNAALLDYIATTVVTMYLTIDPCVSSETWGSWDDRDRQALRAGLCSLTKVTTALRNAFDSPIWAKRITGVDSIRAESTRSKTSKPVDSAEKLKALLG